MNLSLQKVLSEFFQDCLFPGRIDAPPKFMFDGRVIEVGPPIHESYWFAHTPSSRLLIYLHYLITNPDGLPPLLRFVMIYLSFPIMNLIGFPILPHHKSWWFTHIPSSYKSNNYWRRSRYACPSARDTCYTLQCILLVFTINQFFYNVFYFGEWRQKLLV